MLPDNFWIMKAPVLSTIHISKETNDWLGQQEGNTAPFDVEDIEGGWLVFCSDESCLDNPDFYGDAPEDLRNCLRWNISHGYEWLRLDQDGEQVDDLPKFDW